MEMYPGPDNRSAQSSGYAKHLPLCVLILALAVTGVVRWRLLGVPFERDEGEYAYTGWMLLQGVPPYASALSMKLPGIQFLYGAVLWLFGTSVEAVHLALLLANAATTVLIYFVGRRLDGPAAGGMAAASFAVLSITPGVQGVFANAEHFVILFGMAGIFFLFRHMETDKILDLIAAAFLLGLAFLVKQHGVFYGLFALAWLVLNTARKKHLLPGLKRLGLFGAGAAIPFGVVCLYLYQSGVFEDFWFWTVTYALKYSAQIPASIGFLRFTKTSAKVVFSSGIILWVLAALGMAALFVDKGLKKIRFFLAGFTLFSFLGICPGLYFRPHYFLLLLPAVSLLVGVFATSAQRDLTKKKKSTALKYALYTLLAAALWAPFIQNRIFFFQATPDQACRMVYGINPFPESVTVARYIRTNSRPDHKIAVIGSEPQIYFYSQRQAATRYMYTYPMMEDQPFALKMQQDMIREVEEAGPEFLVFVNVPGSWLVRPGSNRYIFKWLPGFIEKQG